LLRLKILLKPRKSKIISARLISYPEKVFFVYLLKIKLMKEISVQELKQKIDNKEDFQLIDVRETFEYEVSNLEGENIPLGGILIETDKIATDKPVIVQCRSGKRSAAAIMQLEQAHGFDNLYNLKGGILAWQEAYDPNMPVY
jgi:rhodanese-related sulfurtransferase